MTRRRTVLALPAVGLLCAELVMTGPSPASAADSGGAAPRAGGAGTVRLFAGGGAPKADGVPIDGVPAADAWLRRPQGLTHDAAGNVYVSSTEDNRVRRVDARTGLISTLAGSRGAGAPPDYGPRPHGVAANAAGDVFVAGADTVAEFTHDGRLLRLIGVDSARPEVRVLAYHAALSPAGDLYLSDYSDEIVRIVKLSPEGDLTTVAGGGSSADDRDGGAAVDVALTGVRALTFSPDGALVFIDGGRVRRVGPDGIISTVAGGGRSTCDGAPAVMSDLRPASGLAYDAAGRLFISETDVYRVQRVDTDGSLHLVWGWGYDDWSPVHPAVLGAPAALQPILSPDAVDVLPDGRLLALEHWNGAEGEHDRVLAVTPGEAAGVARGYAGTGQLAVARKARDGRAACDADLAYPTSVAKAADGSTYVADYQNSQIRRIAPDGRISTVAGTGRPGFSGDGGPATSAQLDRPRAVTIDPAGRVLIADVVNNRVRRLDPATGLITTIAGTGQWGASGDGGPATAGQLAGPHGLAVSPDGTVWVADTGNHTLRRISPDGTISTAAGTGTAGGAGDGGPGTAAQLTAPRGVAVDSRAVYLADPGTSSVRRLDLTTETISTLAGPSTGTVLRNPASLLPTRSGLLVADAGSNRVLRITPTGAVTVVAGTGSAGPAMSRDAAQAALKVNLAQPQGLAAESDGTLIVADTAHHRLLRVSQP